MNAIDTNVLVYACDGRDLERQAIAIDVIEHTPHLVMLWQVACEFIAACRKLEAHGVTQTEAWNHLDRFLKVFPIRLPTVAVVEHARGFHLQQWSFWDAMLIAGCLDAGVTRLYSEDLPGRAPPPGLEIVNPFSAPRHS